MLGAAAVSTWLVAVQLVGVAPVAAAAELSPPLVAATSPEPSMAAAGSPDLDSAATDHSPNIPPTTTGPELTIDPLLRGVAHALGMPAPPETHWTVGLGPLLLALGFPDGSSDGPSNGDDAGPSADAGVGVLARAWRGIRESVGTMLDASVRNMAMVPVWSLTFLDGDRPSPAPRADTTGRHVVVLVHGLDDPGWIWDELAPALRKDGFCPVAFEYPNDGPLRTSADCLGEALVRLREDGVECVDLVSHSMGGLVVRDVLTRPSWYGGDASGSALLPMVDRVIQVAPPNHGAAIAKLQPISELKDHAVRLVRGTARRHGMSLDGVGQAAGDLQPNSAYLCDLNARPLPQGARFTIVEACLAGPSANPPEGLARGSNNRVDATIALCRASSRGVASTVSGWLGDGMVTSDSSRLDGVDDVVVVSGNHHSVLRTWVPGRVPKGVPVIVERLRSR